MPKKRPLLHRLIGKNYVGPGNAIDSAETIGQVDDVAYHHDVLYEAIENSDVNLQRVNSADTGSAVEFLSSAIDSANSGNIIDSVIGFGSSVALTAKAGVEKAIGEPIYPKMAPRKHKPKPSTENPLNLRQGQVGRVVGYQKANLNRAIARLENLKAKGADADIIAEQERKIQQLKGSHNQWNGAKEYHQEAENHRALIADIESFLETPPSSRAEGEVGPDSLGGAGAPQESQEERPIKKYRYDPLGLGGMEEYTEEEMQGITDELRSWGVSEPANIEVINQSDMEIIQSNDEYLTSLGIEDNMANVQQVIRSGGSRYEDGHIIIENSDLFYSWGYNFTGLDIADANNDVLKQKWLMTPMAYVPVDYLPFYMSKAQYDDLPGEAEVVSVACKVTPWGSRVSFQTNAETTAPATAQHVVVGMSATGLNLDPTFNWANRDVTESNTMIISTHAPPDEKKLITKLWGENNNADWFKNVPSTFGAVRQLDIYGGPVVDNYVKPVPAVGTTPAVAEYIPTGWPDLSTRTNRFAYDAFKGKPIMNYSYQPKFGVLKSKQRRWQSNRSDAGGELYTTHGGNDAQYGNLSINRKTADGPNGNQTGTSNQITLQSFTMKDVSFDSKSMVYQCMIERDRCRADISNSGAPVQVQPQLHIGILPVQANQPGASVGFVCAAAYWQIDRVIKIKVNFGTAFNLVVARPIDGMVTYYNDGMDDNFGVQGTVAGRIAKNTPYK